LKRVSVQLDDQTHKALKQYAAFYEKTMSEVLEEMFHMQFQKQVHYLTFMEHLHSDGRVKTDRRVAKPCYSSACFSCRHEVPCKTGRYQGTMEPKEIVEPLLKPAAIEAIAAWKAECEQRPDS